MLGMVIDFSNDTAATEIYTLSLHDALPICLWRRGRWARVRAPSGCEVRQNRNSAATEGIEVITPPVTPSPSDRKSTRLNSSHANISHAVFCLNKKSPYFPTYTYSTLSSHFC